MAADKEVLGQLLESVRRYVRQRLLPLEQQVDREDRSTAMKVLDRGRLHISAVSVGAANRLIEDSVNYAGERRQFGTEIGNFQLIQALLADSRTEANHCQKYVKSALISGGLSISSHVRGRN